MPTLSELGIDRLSVEDRIALAQEIWDNIIKTYPQAPEAAEADLEWAKVLRRQGNTAAAIARLEHLILTYTQSALVFQARRELEIAKGTVPPVQGNVEFKFLRSELN